MADFDEVPAVTGYMVGAVPPIALPSDLKVLVDHAILNYETVVIGSGVLGYAIALERADLMSLLANAEQGLFVKA